MKKGVIFWVVWTVVVGGAGAFYVMWVHPKLSENKVKGDQRGLMIARLIEEKNDIGDIKKPSETIRKYGMTLSKGKTPAGDEAKVGELAPKAFREQGVDKRIYNLYPLNNNLSKIPNETSVKAKKLEEEALVAERESFIKSFKDMQLSVDASMEPQPNRDFKPSPPKNGDLFRQWVMGSRNGQDRQIDLMLEEKLGRGCMKFQEAHEGDPGSACEWLEDGRCSGYIDEKRGDRDLVLKRLLLRRLVLSAVARASAPVRVLVDDKYELGKKLDPRWEEKKLQVQTIDELRFLDGDPAGRDPQKSFVAARINRLSHGNIRLPKEGPAPYRSGGFLLRVKCHAGVVPAVISELEKMKMKVGEGEERSFACWVERVQIGRPAGKTPDWKPEQMKTEEGSRYAEWPVTAEILVVVPEFDETLDPTPKAP